jgi:hypothetical protein
MKVVVAKVTGKRFFVLILTILSTFYLESGAWPYSLSENQNCSANCENLGISNKNLNARNVSSTPADQFTGAQSTNLNSASEVRTITPSNTLSHADQRAATQADKNSAAEGTNAPGPSFFLLLGLVLIGIRLVISYRSRKLKNLAAEPH